MTGALWIASGILIVAALLGLFRVATARDDASRAVVSDLIYFCAVGTFALIAAGAGITVLFDVILVASLLGILATMALARILTRGHR